MPPLRRRARLLMPPLPPTCRRDLHTGTLLTTFKSCSCPPGGLSRLGRDYLVAAQLGRGGGLHFWAWHKDQPHLRCFAAEQLTCVAASPDGAWCAGGGASGAAFVWETSSGRLLRTWPAHYKVGLAGRWWWGGWEGSRASPVWEHACPCRAPAKALLAAGQQPQYAPQTRQLTHVCASCCLQPVPGASVGGWLLVRALTLPRTCSWHAPSSGCTAGHHLPGME